MVNLNRIFEGIGGIIVGFIFVFFIGFQFIYNTDQFLSHVGYAFLIGGIIGFALGIVFVYRGIKD
jgi:hypothetical protein